MISSGSTGLWKREMTAGGVFLHKCGAADNIGTTMSRNISVFVNSKYGAFWQLKKESFKKSEYMW